MAPTSSQDSLVPIFPLAQIPTTRREQSTRVYFDVETTGFSDFDEVLQIAAVCEEKRYNAYIHPSSPWFASSSVTGFHVVDDVLHYKNTPVDVVPMADAWNGFFNFLSRLDKSVILVGHNIAFDLRFMNQEIGYLGLQPHAHALIWDLVDTVKVCKEAFLRLRSYTLEDIAVALGVDTGNDAHNALADCLTLQQICEHVPEIVFARHAVSHAAYRQAKEAKEVTERNRGSLMELKDSGVTAQMIGKLARAGIDMGMLKSTYASSNVDGVCALLQDITRNRRIIDEILDHMRQLVPSEA